MILTICEKCENYQDNKCLIESPKLKELDDDPDLETYSYDDFKDRSADKNYLNVEYKNIIIKTMNYSNKSDKSPNQSTLTGCIEYIPAKSDIPNIENYDYVIESKNEFDFVRNRPLFSAIILFLILNIFANYAIYSNFAIFSKEEMNLIFQADIANESILFPVMATIIIFTSGLLYRTFIYNYSFDLARYMKYIGLAEAGGFFGLMTEMFWAAIFSWSAFVVYFFISFDISHLKPNKDVQLEKSKQLKKQLQSRQKRKSTNSNLSPKTKLHNVLSRGGKK